MAHGTFLNDHHVRFENGVFKPLEDVKQTEGTKDEVHVPTESVPKRPKSVRYWPTFGMWADSDDIPDGVTYEDRMRPATLLNHRGDAVSYVVDTNIIGDVRLATKNRKHSQMIEDLKLEVPDY